MLASKTLTGYGSAFGVSRYQYQPVASAGCLRFVSRPNHCRSMRGRRSFRSLAVSSSGSITDSGISGPAHSPEQYNSGTVIFSFLGRLPARRIEDWRRRFLQDAVPRSAWNGTNTSRGAWVCQSSRSRFTRHFEASLSEAKRGIVLRDH